MTAVAIATQQRRVPAELEQEILARIDRAGFTICEAELRYKLRWDERSTARCWSCSTSSSAAG